GLARGPIRDALTLMDENLMVIAQTSGPDPRGPDRSTPNDSWKPGSRFGHQGTHRYHGVMKYITMLGWVAVVLLLLSTALNYLGV
ncbi:MAG: hypothetical protein RIR28_418, partial [Pseudomonadota bacterium]